MIKITVKGADELARDLNKMASQVEPALQDAIRQSGETAKQNISREAPIFESTLKHSITNQVTRLKAEVFVGASAEKYGYVQEYGRKPGRMPPPNALKKWAAAKLGDSSLAFVLARSIGKKGTKPQPFFKPGFEMSIDTIFGLFDRAVNKILSL